jgi:hypothetical protein
MRVLPETEIHRIWERGFPPETPLCTSDGLSIRIFSPGMANRDGGPDFTGARMQIGGRLYAGDVEIHLTPQDWRRHGHHTDPHYNGVILHVVIDAGRFTPPTRTVSKRTVPLLILGPHFHETAPPSRCLPAGKTSAAGSPRLPCADIPVSVPDTILHKRLLRLGWERLKRRSYELEDRLTHLLQEEHGPAYDTHELLSEPVWRQLFYEGVMEGLGFAKNRKAFRTLAESVPLQLLQNFHLQDNEVMQAILFGAAGLLPSSRGLSHRENRRLVRRLRSRWRMLRRTIRRPLLHEADWLFFRLRPVNFPTARLAAMSFLLPVFFREDCLRRIFRCFAEGAPSAREGLQNLRKMFVVRPDKYWRGHLDFRNAGSSCGIGLGAGRVDAIILHLVVPAVMLRARLSGNRAFAARARAMARVLSPPPSNALTRLMERDLLRGREGFRGAVMRQGLMLLWKEYCRKRRCRHCPFLSTVSTRRTTRARPSPGGG